MTDENIKVHERMAIIETKVIAIMENHLPHIQRAIDKLSNKFWALIILLITNLVVLIVAFIK